MVSFSCEVCNDTVVKKKLDQHARQCYGAYFTCIDCSTTFSGTDYRNHTQCISEAEKYEKSLYKGNKKQTKQQAAPVEVVVEKQVIETTKTTAKAEPKKKESKKSKKAKKEETESDDESESLLSKHYKDNESLYKIFKKISKDNKKSTKQLLKDAKLVKKNGNQYVLEF